MYIRNNIKNKNKKTLLRKKANFDKARTPKNNNNKKKFESPFIMTVKNQIERIQNNSQPDNLRKYHSYITNEDYTEEPSELSGSEPKYEPTKWNLKDNIRDTHNCYAYVINKISASRDNKPQPGYFSGYGGITNSDYDCATFYQRMKKDIPGLYLINYKKKCQEGFHKGFIAIAPPTEGDTDYHFYRQDSNGYWSHKPGRTEATDLDSVGKKIINPLMASRKGSHFDYSVPCFYFCVNNHLAHLHSTTPHY
jgi:hypothetical protein